MKLLILIIWYIIIFISTCTENPDSFVFNGKINFHWLSRPHFSDLLIISDTHISSFHWLLFKAGHMMGFAILFILLYNYTEKISNSVKLSLIYASLTEILQLYFNRDGRLLDIGIDSIGIIIAYLLTRKFKSKISFFYSNKRN